MSEQEVRALRCRVFGEVADDAWKAVKERWMTPENQRWLLASSKIPPFFPAGIHWKIAVHGQEPATGTQ